MELTVASQNKSFVDGHGVKHDVIMMRRMMFLCESIDPDCPNGTFHLNLFYADGRMKGSGTDKDNLVSEYVKPRTKDEVGMDLIKALTTDVVTTTNKALIKNCKLLEEARKTFGESK